MTRWETLRSMGLCHKPFPEEKPCPECDGVGYHDFGGRDFECAECCGSGWVVDDSKFTELVPHGELGFAVVDAEDK